MVIVVPFRAGGKSRLPAELRTDVALAMLGDVVEAAVAVGDVRVVSGDPAGRLVAAEQGAALVEDQGKVRARPWWPVSRRSTTSVSS